MTEVNCGRITIAQTMQMTIIIKSKDLVCVSTGYPHGNHAIYKYRLSDIIAAPTSGKRILPQNKRKRHTIAMMYNVPPSPPHKWVVATPPGLGGATPGGYPSNLNTFLGPSRAANM